MKDGWSVFRALGIGFGITLASWGLPHIGFAQYTSVVTAGGQDFRSYCATCHGLEAKGDGPAVAVLTVKPPDLTQLSKHNGGTFPFEQTYEQIDGSNKTVVPGHGTSEMPIWGDVFRRERGTAEQWLLGTKGRILSLVHYLESIQEE